MTNMDKSTIESQVRKVALDCIGEKFEFRPHQLEAIVNIIHNIFTKGNENYVLEAPTGTGKSLINILAAKVLWDFYEMKSHILCSDLSLFQQYENFLKEHPKFDIPYIKGQTGNFFCELNGNDVRNGDCRMAQISWKKLMYPIHKPIATNYGYKCCKTCEYVINRRKALESPIVVTTYQLYMFCMNVPMGNMDSSALQPKHIVFCDECHNIPSLVQSQYTPIIKEEDFGKFIELYNFARDLPDVSGEESSDVITDGIIYDKYKTSDELYYKFLDLWERYKNPKQSKEDLFETTKVYSEILDDLGLAVGRIQPVLGQKKSSAHEKLTSDEVHQFKLSNWFANYQCFMHDFSTAVEETSQEYMIKDINEEEVDMFSPTKKIVELHCVKEDYMVFTFLLRHSPYRVMVSATVGSKESFEENCGLYFTTSKNCIMEKIPSGFNFTKSPIIFLSRYKMSMREQDKNLPYVRDVIFQILKNKFSNERGIIQTGSYAIAKKIFDCAPPEIQHRMLLYRGSRDKNDKIELHKILDNTILMGPTLNQGIDLPGDLCRFIIICKVPYPSLGSQLVRSKCELFPSWYNSTTSTEIIQGIGRGVRYNGDYCQTYILDGCFGRLYKETKDQYSPELQARMKFV